MDSSAANPWLVLLIDDDEDDFWLTREMLSRAQGRKITLVWAATYTDGLESLLAKTYDAVLVDYDLGLQTGIELIRTASASGTRAPLILFTSRDTYDVDLEAMQAGATLYLTKDEATPLVLERAIRYAIERKRFEQERLDLVESIQDGFFALDRDWRFIYVNRQAAQVMDLEPEMLIGCNIWASYPALLGTPLEQYYRQVMEARTPVQFEMLGVLGPIWFSINVYPFHDGISVYWQDISERKRRDAALRESDERFRTVFERAEIGIAITDMHGGVIESNPALERMLGYTKDELFNRPFMSFTHPADIEHEMSLVQDLLESRRDQYELEKRYIRKDGETIQVRVIGSMVRDSQGEPQLGIALVEDITQRKLVEADLKLSEERFSRAFEATPTALVVSRLVDGRIEMVNDSFERLFGYTRAELIGSTLLELNLFVNPITWGDLVRRLDTEGTIRNLETAIRQKSGETRQASLSTEMLTLRGEQHILTILEDITERKRAEADRRDNEAILRMALSAAQAGVWSWDLAADRLQWSDEYYRIFGFEPGSITPSSEAALRHVHPDDRERVEAAIKDAMDNGTQIDIEHRVVWPDGSLHWVRGLSSVYYDDQSIPQRMGGLALDITEQKQAELKLALANRRNVEVLESIRDAFYSLDLSGCFTYVNQKAASLWGKTTAELLGKNIWETFPAGKETLAYGYIQQALVDKQPAHFDSYSSFLDQWVEIHVYPSEHGVSVYFQDITSRKREEQTLAAYAQELERRNRELQEFVFVASHDLQEPLRKIEALGEMIAKGKDTLSAEQSEQIGRLHRTVGRMRQMVDGLYQLARLSSQDPAVETVDVRQVAQAVLADLELSFKRAHALIETGPLPVIQADPGQMRQLLHILLSNAIKFQPPGAQPKVNISSRQLDEHRVQILVQDNGIGFRQDQVERLFYPFKRLVGRTEYEGSGIGLAIARKIVERHGGEISAQSERGQGTTFFVTLPLDPPSIPT